ncbi:hypothetical protein Syun_000800 [Stephania yunnanensis]|uniref:Uncharacterized protein n=1 Tax=Stephania yunnanensis TaxID=152371 RepID=A0AAP0LFG4_9MAGN
MILEGRSWLPNTIYPKCANPGTPNRPNSTNSTSPPSVAPPLCPLIRLDNPLSLYTKASTDFFLSRLVSILSGLVDFSVLGVQ